jgi:glycosyltransferase involved in cell wall biosynthesis
MKPSVSICVPMYNGAAHLRECLESAFSQTFADIEVLLVDDGSTDDTVAIAEHFARRDSRVRLYRNSKNLGLVANWNKCVELTKGEWIKFLFQDDFLEPTCVERMFEARRLGVSLVVCQRGLEFEPRTPQTLRQTYLAHCSNYSLARAFSDQSVICAAEFSQLLLKHPNFNWIGEPTATMVHSSAFERFGRFNSDLVMFCDWEFFARVAVQTGISFVPDPLATFRVHHHSVSATNRNRYYRSEIIDPLIIQHQLAYLPAFEPVRVAAGRSKPRVNMEHRLVASARNARWLARQLANDPTHPDPQALADWHAIVSRYPRLESLPPTYVLAGAVRRAKSICSRVFHAVQHA